MSRVRLGDIVSRVKDFVDKDNTDLMYYVGGEHFDNRSLTVNRKGIIKGSTIGPAFHTKFTSGDVLLMSRNPHLRKAGIVDFDGICSDVSYIIRTKDEKIIKQRFIPLLFQSDIFWNFAERNKKGSTNFFLNWSDFEKFEFDLPDIDEQEKLCAVLWAIDDTLKSYQEQIKQCDELAKGQFVEMFGDPEINHFNWDIVNISTILTDKASNGYFAKKEDYDLNGNAKVLGVVNIVNTLYSNLVNMPVVNVKETDIEKYAVRYGDVLFCRSSLVAEGIGKASVVPKDVDNNVLFECHVIRLRLDIKRIVPEFLQALTTMDYFRNQILRSAKTATMTTIGQEGILKCNIILPPIDKQNDFLSFINQIYKSKFDIKEAMNNAQKIFDGILRENLC